MLKQNMEIVTWGTQKSLRHLETSSKDQEDVKSNEGVALGKHG